MRRLLFCFLFLSCASPPPVASPEWQAIPLGIIDTFCLRLRAEGLAEGQPVAVVSTTQPIATVNSIVALGGPVPRKVNAGEAAAALRESQKSIPLTLGGGGCRWIAVDAARAYRQSDQMIVEMSAPLPNPFERGQAGIFVRVSLAGEHGQWYWISLLPKSGGWVVGNIRALAG